MKLIYKFWGLLFSIFSVSFLYAQNITPSQLDSMVNKALQTFNVPGMAISIVKDGKIFCSKGYDFQDLHFLKRTD